MIILFLILEHFGDFKTMEIEEAIRHLKVHEMRLKKMISREQDQALLSWAFTKTNKNKGFKLDDQGCKSNFQDGFISIHERKVRFLTKTFKTSGNIYLMKLNISKQCFLEK